jgi:hypothetical protein
MERYLRFGYRCLTVGGALVAAGGLIYAATYITPFSADVGTTGFLVGAVLRLLGLVGIMGGMAALGVRQADRSRAAGPIAGLVMTGALTLWAGTVFVDLFVSGALAKANAALVDGTESDDRMILGFMLAFFFVALAFISFGIVTLRARTFPRSVGWLLTATGVVALVPLPVSFPVSDLELGILMVCAGLIASRVGSPGHEVSVASDVSSSRSATTLQIDSSN